MTCAKEQNIQGRARDCINRGEGGSVGWWGAHSIFSGTPHLPLQLPCPFLIPSILLPFVYSLSSQTGPSLQSFVKEVKLQSLCQCFPHLMPLVLFRLLVVTFSMRPDQILFSSSRDRDCSTEKAARSTETHCEENTTGR